MISRSWIACLIALDVVLWVAALLWPAWQEEERPMSVVVGLWPGSESLIVAGERGYLPQRQINLVEIFKRIEQPGLAKNRQLLDPAHGSLVATIKGLSAYMQRRGMLTAQAMLDPTFVNQVPDPPSYHRS